MILKTFEELDAWLNDVTRQIEQSKSLGDLEKAETCVREIHRYVAGNFEAYKVQYGLTYTFNIVRGARRVATYLAIRRGELVTEPQRHALAHRGYAVQ